MFNNIIILLSTYNGSKYLKQQLDSLLSQTNTSFQIIARDDCSADNTLDILKSYNIKVITSAENLGACGSFSALLDYAVHNTNSNYFMFCDQDDVWESDKIEKTLQTMLSTQSINPQIPVLVHTDLQVVGEHLETIQRSFMQFQNIDSSYNGLNNLLIQNTVTCCTVMINRQLAELSTPIPNDVTMHDWWLGIVASQFGLITFLPESTIKYRQHSSNTIGAKGYSFVTIVYKFYKIFRKKGLYLQSMGDNIKQAEEFLNMYKCRLNTDTIQMLEDFIYIEDQSFWHRRVILIRHRLLKQGILRNMGLILKI